MELNQVVITPRSFDPAAGLEIQIRKQSSTGWILGIEGERRTQSLLKIINAANANVGRCQCRLDGSIARPQFGRVFQRLDGGRMLSQLQGEIAGG